MNDRKWKPDIPEPRKPKPPEYRVPGVPESPPMPGNYKEPWYRFYRRNGFKRILGGVTLITGGILSLIPVTSAIGQGILVFGGVIEGIGIGDAVKKKSKWKDDSWKHIIQFIIWVTKKIITKRFTKKGDSK